MVWFADVTVENRPMMISSYTVPEASGSFCERGGRFGSHSSNESMALVFYGNDGLHCLCFNAGVRTRYPPIPTTQAKLDISFPRLRQRQYALRHRRWQGTLSRGDPNQQCGDG